MRAMTAKDARELLPDLVERAFVGAERVFEQGYERTRRACGPKPAQPADWECVF